MRRANHFCGGPPAFSRGLGVILMISGLILLIVSLPFWLWAAMLGAIMVAVGFVLWRVG